VVFKHLLHSFSCFSLKRSRVTQNYCLAVGSFSHLFGKRITLTFTVAVEGDGRLGLASPPVLLALGGWFRENHALFAQEIVLVLPGLSGLNLPSAIKYALSLHLFISLETVSFVMSFKFVVKVTT